ncbi:glycosyltransferase family 2 protein [Winogradskyella tangerina]|uniref:glycosyltransferase family 2 protein n=1 Tax=Winogradskyella tangerina TaxID=2023240 RepID=UPI000DBE417A|nr:glycosyltransferase family 2 protein [Winogradskyella tangerina]
MKLSVVILNYNVRYFLEVCLRSVEAAVKDINAEIIVVDNKSSDGSCEMVKTQFPSVHLIENDDNYGFSKGNNIGVAKAKGDYLCILNPDTIVAEDTFSKIIEFADSKSNLGIVGCQLIDGSGQFLPESKRQIPTPKVAFQKLMGNTENYYTSSLQSGEIGKTDILVGAFMLLKRSVYNEVNGFDEDYFMYGEDIDLSYKILKAGYTNYYFGETTIIHFKGESTHKNKIYAKRFYGAMEIFYKKHFAFNPVVTLLVKLGLNLASKRKRLKGTAPANINNCVIVTDAIFNGLKSKLNRSITFTQDLNNLPSDAQIIFDTSIIDFKAIVNYMLKHKNSNQNTYRILLKNSNFILGSDSNQSKGEVIPLD